jgi:hypothetical protein
MLEAWVHLLEFMRTSITWRYSLVPRCFFPVLIVWAEREPGTPCAYAPTKFSGRSHFTKILFTLSSLFLQEALRRKADSLHQGPQTNLQSLYHILLKPLFYSQIRAPSRDSQPLLFLASSRLRLEPGLLYGVKYSGTNSLSSMFLQHGLN